MANIMTVMFLMWTGAQTAPSTPLSLEPNRSSSEYGHKNFIAYGTPYDPIEYPYVTRLYIDYSKTDVRVCTGSLITPSYVLTAAHCCHDITADIIQVFHANKKDHASLVEKMFVHHNYVHPKPKGDIALLKLKPPFVTIDKYAIMAGHPDEFANNAEIDCVIIGFGRTDKDEIEIGYMANSKVKYGRNACKQSNSPIVKDTWQEFLCSVPDLQMTCTGDSGGPMICNGNLYGISSHGFKYNTVNASSAKCGNKDIQTRHLFIYAYRDWIEKMMKIKKKSKKSKKSKSSASCYKLSNTILAMTVLYIVLLKFFF